MVDLLIDRGLAAVYITTAILAVILIIVLYSLLASFAPMKLENLSMVPNKVCPSELVSADAELEIDKGLYSLAVDPSWTNVDDGRYWDIAEASFPVEGPVKTNKGSETLVYQAPAEPGRWVFSVDTIISGRKGILPREQVFTAVKSQRVTDVVDCGDAYTYEQYLKEREGR